MKGLSRRTMWLGWVVAGVLALSAGGVAIAQSTQTTQPTQTTKSTDQQPGGKLRPKALRAFGGAALGGAAFGRGARGQILHGEVTVETSEGRKTFVTARGKVTALSGTSITITSSDNVATTFSINNDTRFGFWNFEEPRAELKTGDTAMVIGTRSGNTNTATRIGTNRNPRD